MTLNASSATSKASNRIVQLSAVCDPKASVINAYWSIKTDFICNEGNIWLMSDCNCSFYSHSRPDIPRNIAGTLFDCWDISVVDIENAEITVTDWQFGKQSEFRYMRPKNEGCLYVTVNTDGVEIKGLRHHQSMNFKLFITNFESEEISLNAIKSVASEKLLAAIEQYKNSQ